MCKDSYFYMIYAFCVHFVKIKFADMKNVRIFAVLFREHSSVGLEHLPYKQRVGGSTPSAPTKAFQIFSGRLFSLSHIVSVIRDRLRASGSV